MCEEENAEFVGLLDEIQFHKMDFANPVTNTITIGDVMIFKKGNKVWCLDDFTWELKWAKNKSVWSSTSQAEIAMKEKWKVIFLNREQEIFEIIWNNQNFRNNIFEINISRIDAELDFHDFISNSSSIIYNFIKVR